MNAAEISATHGQNHITRLRMFTHEGHNVVKFRDMIGLTTTSLQFGNDSMNIDLFLRSQFVVLLQGFGKNDDVCSVQDIGVHILKDPAPGRV